jgi:hypothetical protein
MQMQMQMQMKSKSKCKCKCQQQEQEQMRGFFRFDLAQGQNDAGWDLVLRGGTLLVLVATLCRRAENEYVGAKSGIEGRLVFAFDEVLGEGF